MKRYVYAESIFLFDNLSKFIQKNLLESDKPIGLLWKEEKLETYREIIGYNLSPCPSVSAYFNGTDKDLILSRYYFIHHNHKVMGIITEKFPLEYFKEI